MEVKDLGLGEKLLRLARGLQVETAKMPWLISQRVRREHKHKLIKFI